MLYLTCTHTVIRSWHPRASALGSMWHHLRSDSGTPQIDWSRCEYRWVPRERLRGQEGM